MNKFHRTVSIPAELLVDTQADRLITDAVSEMGRSLHESQKQMARGLGMSVLPGCIVRVNGRLVVIPPVSL